MYYSFCGTSLSELRRGDHCEYDECAGRIFLIQAVGRPTCRALPHRTCPAIPFSICRFRPSRHFLHLKCNPCLLRKISRRSAREAKSREFALTFHDATEFPTEA